MHERKQKSQESSDRLRDAFKKIIYIGIEKRKYLWNGKLIVKDTDK